MIKSILSASATVYINGTIRSYVEELLRDEIQQLELTSAARERLLPSYVRAAVVEIVANTVVRLEIAALGEAICEEAR